MSERFRLNCKRLLMGVACGLGMLVLASGQASAGTLEIVITDGTITYDILDDGPLDTLTGPNAIQALAPALVFPDFKVIGLNAATNNPGADNPTGANLQFGGEIQRTTANVAPSLTITVSDTDYTLPGGPKTLTGTASGTYTNTTAGDSQHFQGWFNPSNVQFAKETTSGGGTFVSSGPFVQSVSGSSLPLPVGSAPTYGLTAETVLTLGGVAPGTTSDVLFATNLQVLGTVVPEPASLAIMLPALPVVIMGWYRHRKARATSSN